MPGGSGRLKLSTKQYRELESFRNQARDLARNDIDKFIQAFFKIKVKKPGAPLETMKFNYPQLQSRKWRNEDRANNLPIRHFYLKSRQVGQSTDAMADAAAHTWAMDNYESLVIAHDKDRASKLLLMAHTMFDNLPEPLQIMLERSTSEKIRFKGTNSGMAIMTAANFEAGRGNTIHEVQFSEFCFYDDPPAVVRNVNQLLPSLPGTQGIIETTALNAGSPAHKFWEEAWENRSLAETGKRIPPLGYKGYFHPWQDDPSNIHTFETERELHDFIADLYYSYPDVKDRAEAYQLSPEQVAYYGINLYKCEGDEILCQQEYPCDPMEAWISQGKPIFPLKQLAQYYKGARPGRLYHPYTEDFKSTGEIRMFSRLNQLLENKDILRNGEPYIEVWQPPIPKRRYAIGADGAAGYTTGDFSSAFVIDLVSLEMVAEIHGRLEPSEFAVILRSVGAIYNNALVAPEVEGLGLTVLSHLKDKYINVYYRREETAKGMKVSGKMGWSTNTATRPGLVANAKRIFLERYRQGSSKMKELVKSQMLINELRTYINGRNGKPEAAPGCHDDRVMAWFITLVAAMHEVYNTIATEDGALPDAIASPSLDRNPRMEDVMETVLEWASGESLFAE